MSNWERPGCTCDTPHGSEARLCGYCLVERAAAAKPKRKTKQKKKNK